jgi:hypothetical protein
MPVAVDEMQRLLVAFRNLQTAAQRSSERERIGAFFTRAGSVCGRWDSLVQLNNRL